MKNWQDVVVIFVLIGCFALGIAGILNLRKGTLQPPKLTVNLDNTTYTDNGKVPVTGKADPGSTLTVNGQDVSLDSNGNFNTTVNLTSGDNKISFVANSGGQNTTIDKQIVLQSNEKAVAGAQTGSGATNLSTSGPAENILGTLGLTALILSLANYYRSKRKVTKYSKLAS